MSAARRISGLITLSLAMLGALTEARAHPLLQNPLTVVLERDAVRVRVEVSVKEICVAQGIRAEPRDVSDLPKLQAAAERHADYVLTHLRVSADSAVLSGKLGTITPPPRFTSAEETRYGYELLYPLRRGGAPQTVALSHQMLGGFLYAPGMPWVATYAVSFQRLGSLEQQSDLLLADKTVEFVTGLEPIPAQSGWRTFRAYLEHGAMHILTGYDHLLFVAALVLATASFWEMVKVIAAFTAAHTLTLALSVFDVVRLPSWVVEPVIALSIIFVALENVFAPRSSHSRARLAVAFGFGLIHGLGFAGGLLDAMAGLPALGAWIALAAFSIGVEIGHQVVVLPLFAALALGRRTLREPFHSPALRFGSVAISLAGAYFLVLSVHEQFFGP